MPPRTYVQCRECGKRRTETWDRLCWYCRRMVDPDRAEVRKAADRERARRRRAREKHAGPQYFTPPPP